jgi:hypothetical protein
VVEGTPEHLKQSRHPRQYEHHLVWVVLGEALSVFVEALESELLVHKPGQH